MENVKAFDLTGLTIIIPCFNVKQYIEACINSILLQEYSSWKLILVDDGSTDGTGIICDNYAKKDDRISVIHTNNNGSSTARYTGLKQCSTRYVTFVDSDDFIHPKMYEIMMDFFTYNDTIDIIQCGVEDYYDTQMPKFPIINEPVSYQQYNREDGVMNILRDTTWRSYMVNKIYKIELFNNISFPKNRCLDEDTSIMHLIFNNANSSIYISSPLYYYRHREGSICLSFSVEKMAQKAYDRSNARWERLQFVEQHAEYKELLNMQRNNYVAVALAVSRIVAKYPQLFPTSFFNDIHRRIASCDIYEYASEYWTIRKKIELFILMHFPHIFKIFYKIIPACK